MARKPVASNESAPVSINYDDIRFARVASAATRDSKGALLPDVTTKITLDTDYSIPRLMMIFEALMAEAEKTGENIKTTLTCWPVSADRKSKDFLKNFNQEVKLNLESLSEKIEIDREAFFSIGKKQA